MAVFIFDKLLEYMLNESIILNNMDIRSMSTDNPHLDKLVDSVLELKSVKQDVNSQMALGTKSMEIEIANKDVNEKISDTDIDPKMIIHQKIKRTSKRRPTQGSKSIIQSAIARKEQSFENYLKPKSKINIKNVKNKYAVKKAELFQSPTLKQKKIVQNNTKKIKRNITETEKNNLVIKASCNLGESEPNLRRSQRTLSCDNKQDSLSVDIDEDEYIKAQLNSRLCKCTENKDIFMEAETDSQFCTAIDNIGDKLIGCSKLVDVKSVSMHRPSTRIPFGVFCNSHIQRLTNHNCCPTCGLFCTQGEFCECPLKHHFHKDCILSIGDMRCCPHCGDRSTSNNIQIKMYSSKKPVFLPIQRSHHTSAKMSFDSNKEGSENVCLDKDSEYPIIVPEQLEILKSNVNIDLTDCNEYDLIEAIQDNDVGRVAAILGSGNINLKARLEDFHNGTFLHLASLKGNLQIVYLLVSSLMDIDFLDEEQNSPLMLSVTEHKNDIVKYLVKSGANVRLKGTDGMTALHIAAKCGNLEACQILIRSTPIIYDFMNSQDDGGWTPLVWACELGYIEVVKYLVLKGADINIRDVEHNVALHWAAFSGSIDIIELLLNWKCDIDVVNVHGDTPLHISAREDQYNSVIILLARGAHISIINKNNETPLDCTPKDGKCISALTLNAHLVEAVSTSTNKIKSLLTNDISNGREHNPIQCVNYVDLDPEPKNFTYIKKNCITSDNIHINVKVSTIQTCSCKDRCTSSECACGRLSLRCWYDEDGKLSPDFNFFDPPIIFECNEMCSCNSILCINRLVQRPLTQRFQLFKTNTKGWGIKTLNYIAKGSYVCEYKGEILTDTEADHREDDSYLFDLDNRDTDSFCIDAKYYGNFARFINHSCDPNLHPIKVFIEHHDLRFPRIAFFAKRDISSNEELSFDYGDKFWLVKYKSFTCDCGADICKYSEETIHSTLEKYQIIV